MLRLKETALTFDDVLLLPDYSEVLPNNVDLTTRLTKNLSINIPIISSAMDTVTESRMAIALAELGGIGIIHRNLSIVDQANEVRAVKKFESGIVRDPSTISSGSTVGDLVQLTKELNISGMPVVDDGNLVGIVTSRDFRNESNMTATVSSIMTPKEKLITAKENESIDNIKTLLYRNRIEKILLVDDAFSLKGLITLKDINKSKDYPSATKDSEGRLLVGAAIGNSVDTDERTEKLVQAGVDVLVVDSAHGHSQGVLERVKKVKVKRIYKKMFTPLSTRTATWCLLAIAIALAGPGYVLAAVDEDGNGVNKQSDKSWMPPELEEKDRLEREAQK